MHKGQTLELIITDLAFGGKGIAKQDDLVIFVDGALPGQTVEAKITLKKRRHAEAKCLKVITRSPDEVENDFQSIPGAPWVKLPIEIQQQHKQEQVFTLFQKFAGLDLEPVFDRYLESPTIWHYRNKMEYSFGPTTETLEPGLEADKGEWKHKGFGLGSKKRGQFWLVENLEKDSGLFDAEFENLIPTIRQWCQSIEPTVYNSRTNEGFWRGLMVRKSFDEDKFLINVITAHQPTLVASAQGALANLLKENLGERFKGLLWTQSDDLGNPATKYQSRELISGEPTLEEFIGELKFTISIDSFFQTNVHSAEELYSKVVDYVHPESTQVYDLFCGTGTIGQFVAKQLPQANIVGVEIIESAVRDAQANAAKNKIQNAKFIAADINKWIKGNTLGNGSTVILDPPRAGISPKVLQKIADSQPSQIVYVSCNPATMARDSELLEKSGYKLRKICLVDQFPHTSHVECVGNFIKNT